MNPPIPSILPFRPPCALANASAPPWMLTELSTPLGLPCITFSATNAHLLTSSEVAVGIARLPWWETCAALEVDAPCEEEAGRVTRLYARSMAADTHELYDADEPSPAPMGRVDRAVKSNAGLKIAQYQRQYGCFRGRVERRVRPTCGPHTARTCINTRTKSPSSSPGYTWEYLPTQVELLT